MDSCNEVVDGPVSLGINQKKDYLGTIMVIHIWLTQQSSPGPWDMTAFLMCEEEAKK